MDIIVKDKHIKFVESLIKQFKRAYSGVGNKEIKKTWELIENYELRIKNKEPLTLKYIRLLIENIERHL